MKKYIFASDHGGFELKQELIAYVKSQGDEVVDLGTNDGTTSVSYADYGHKLAEEVLANPGTIGIGLCGTGLGISYALNRHKGIRAARVTSIEDGVLAKQHNNANVLAFGGRQTSSVEAAKIIEAYNETQFEGGRHQMRIDALDK